MVGKTGFASFASLCFVCAYALYVGGCGKLVDPSTSVVADPATTPPLKLSLKLKWEGAADGTEETVGTCEVPAGSAEGTTTACSITVPEGRLFFSDVDFVLEHLSGVCGVILFQPYYYQASVNAAFTPNWGTSAIDCSVVPPTTTEVDCFNGVAKEIVPSFPTYRAVYEIPGSETTTTWTATAANTRSPGNSNRWTTNNLQAATQAAGVAIGTGDGLVANRFVDYSWSCADQWLDSLYRITLTLSDEDNVTSASSLADDQAEDWKPY